jgi:hypothetical protein
MAGLECNLTELEWDAGMELAMGVSFPNAAKKK